jgi:hypothetical protein
VSGRLGALAAALSAEVQHRSRRAFLLALGGGLLAVFALGASVLPSGIASNLLLVMGVFLAVFGASLALLLIQAFGGAFGDALAVAGWARLDADERRKAEGAGRIPRSPAEARAWLSAHPEPATFQSHRLSAQILAGELDAARATLATYPSATPLDRFEMLDDGWFLDFLEGEDPDLAPLAAAADQLTVEPERTFAAVIVATLRAHAAVAAGGDWVAPLAAERPRLGERAAGIVGGRYVAASWTLMMAGASVIIGFALLVGRATGVWGSG